MKSYYFIFLFAVNVLNAQNLVPNASFEIYSEMLSTFMANADLEYATPWFNTPTDPVGGGGATPDYINITMPLTIYNNDTYEFQTPKSGNAMAGFVTSNHTINSESVLSEPFQTRLKEAMVVGETYQVSFYIKKANYYDLGECQIGSDELGIYFHTDTIYTATLDKDSVDIDGYLKFYEMDTTDWGNPYAVFSEFLQEPDVALDTLINDEENWYLVTDIVFADKPYEFMTFARFNLFEDIQWAIDEDCMWGTSVSMMLVDDVSVHLVNEEHIDADAGQDTTICNGASVQIGTSEYEDYMYWWTPNEDMEMSIYGNVNPGMPWLSPIETTTYTLTQKDFAFVETTDQITITVEECIGINEYEMLAESIIVSPNPASNFVTIKSKYEITSWKLLDGIGREVLSSKVKVENTFSVNISSFDAGVYYLELIINNQRIVKDLLLINQE